MKILIFLLYLFLAFLASNGCKFWVVITINSKKVRQLNNYLGINLLKTGERFDEKTVMNKYKE